METNTAVSKVEWKQCIMYEEDSHFSLLVDWGNPITLNISWQNWIFSQDVAHRYLLLSELAQLDKKEETDADRETDVHAYSRNCLFWQVRRDIEVQRSPKTQMLNREESHGKVISRVHKVRWLFREWKVVSADEMKMNNVERKEVTRHYTRVQIRWAQPWVSMVCIRVMEGLGGGKIRVKGQGRGTGGACIDEPRKSVCARYPGAEQTYLQRLNKTSLCQTIQGMAGHSLCGWWGGGRGGEVGSEEKDEKVEGWKEGKWVRRGEKDSSVSLTWQVYHTSQWSGRRPRGGGGTECWDIAKTEDMMGDTGCAFVDAWMCKVERARLRTATQYVEMSSRVKEPVEAMLRDWSQLAETTEKTQADGPGGNKPHLFYQWQLHASSLCKSISLSVCAHVISSRPTFNNNETEEGWMLWTKTPCRGQHGGWIQVTAGRRGVCGAYHISQTVYASEGPLGIQMWPWRPGCTACSLTVNKTKLHKQRGSENPHYNNNK